MVKRINIKQLAVSLMAGDRWSFAWLLLLFAITLSLISCSSRFSSQKYLSEEDKAILDLLPEMVEMDYMLNHNEYGANPPILYVFGELANKLLIGYGYEVFEVEIGSGDTIGSCILDGGLSDEEKIQLKLLISNKIPKREISESLFKNIDKLNIKVLSIDEMEAIENDSLIEKFENDGVFGYLDISRIIFSYNYQKGFVSFSFFCGEACAWNSVIEIEKINGKWIKKREISGGIALNLIEYKDKQPTMSNLVFGGCS